MMVVNVYQDLVAVKGKNNPIYFLRVDRGFLIRTNTCVSIVTGIIIPTCCLKKIHFFEQDLYFFINGTVYGLLEYL